jgi:hypothetical protein
LVYFETFGILWPFGIFYSRLAHFEVIWYIYSRFGAFCQEKSGNPAPVVKQSLKQGDQMSFFEKIAQNVSRSIFCQI